MDRQISMDAMCVNAGTFSQQFFIKIERFCIVEGLNTMLCIATTSGQEFNFKHNRILVLGYKIEQQSQPDYGCVLQLPIAKVSLLGLHNSNIQCIPLREHTWLVMVQLYHGAHTHTTHMHYILLTNTHDKLTTTILAQPTLLSYVQILQPYQPQTSTHRLPCIWYDTQHEPVLQLGYLSVRVGTQTDAKLQCKQELQCGMIDQTLMISAEECVQVELTKIGPIPVYEHMLLKTCMQVVSTREYDCLVTEKYVNVHGQYELGNETGALVMTYEYQGQSLGQPAWETGRHKCSQVHKMNNINNQQICAYVQQRIGNNRVHAIQILHRRTLHVLYTYDTTAISTTNPGIVLLNQSYVLFSIADNKISILTHDGYLIGHFYYMGSRSRPQAKLIGPNRLAVAINGQAHFVTLRHTQGHIKEDQPQQQNRVYLAM